MVDGSGPVQAWANVHDRAAGRVDVEVIIDPELTGSPDDTRADSLAERLFDWAAVAATGIGAHRGLTLTQLDSSAFSDDERQQRWLAAAGYAKARTWWQMSRPVTAAEGAPDAMPAPRAGVVVRRVGAGVDGLPDEHDVRTVHGVLEAAFADHFNSYQETFDEFCSRLKEDPGHRWDHWWIATLTNTAHTATGHADREVAGSGRPAQPPLGQGDADVAGALVGAVLPAGSSPNGEVQPEGSYIAYMGVLPNARGRGVAKSLLYAVIADAARRGRNRVGLEVDADSPTGAEAMYQSMGWQTSYMTQSWHREITVPS